jgi:hypothetical protein
VIAHLVNRPHRLAVKLRRDVVIVARGHLVAGVRRFLGFRFALPRDDLERSADVDESLDPLLDARDVPGDAQSASTKHAAGVTLIPIDAVRLNDVVEDPALLVPAADIRFTGRLTLAPAAVGALRRGGAHGGVLGLGLFRFRGKEADGRGGEQARRMKKFASFHFPSSWPGASPRSARILLRPLRFGNGRTVPSGAARLGP